MMFRRFLSVVLMGLGFSVCAEESTPALLFSRANDFLVQFQNFDPEKVGNSAFDVVVMDYSSDGKAGGEYSSDVIEKLKKSPGGEKVIISYLSIGEAEDYRYYWKPEWTKNPPAWMEQANPDWPGNYKVKFWEKEWQNIIYGTSESFLDKIIAAGFDGAYLDIIDAFEYWTPAFPDADAKMKKFVADLAAYARSRKPGFLVISSNAAALCEDAAHMKVIDGIGAEDTWYNGDEIQNQEFTASVVPQLKKIAAAGKKVLCIDYVSKNENIADFYGRARKEGFVPYATTRGLENLTVNSGFAPD